MPQVILTFVLLLLSQARALAHSSGDFPATGDWNLDPYVIGALIASATLYAIGTGRLLGRARGSARRMVMNRAWLFTAGWLALALALVSPVHGLGEQLFSIHMIEHEIVMQVGSPLLVLSRPLANLLFALPNCFRRPVKAFLSNKKARSVWFALTTTPIATATHGFAIWAWHIPPFFDATIKSPFLHRFQHLSFLVSALLFWWSVRRSGPATGAVHLFLTMLHTSLLGALIALSPRILYGVQTEGAVFWGLTALEDQQLAGLIMWIPGGILYAVAALVLLSAWIRRSSAEEGGYGNEAH